MACHVIRIGLIVGAISAAASVARAQDGCQNPTGPTTRTIKVTECVPETYQEKRTCYRVECREEQYDAVRYEPYCEVRERTCTVTKRIPEYHTETIQVPCKVMSCEDRVVMKSCYEYRTVTCMQKKCVSRGHWECREVCKEPGCFKKMCDPCACPRTVCKKCWVSCPEYIDCPVTKCVKVCVQHPVVCKVNVCHTVMKERQVQRCTYRCVQEQHVEKYTVQLCKQVPVKATRMVRVCVPYEETVTCCRMVAREREVQVQDCGCCCTSCCCPCRCDNCCNGCRSRHSCCN